MPGVAAVSGDGPNLRQHSPMQGISGLWSFKSNFSFTSEVVLY